MADCRRTRLSQHPRTSAAAAAASAVGYSIIGRRPSLLLLSPPWRVAVTRLVRPPSARHRHRPDDDRPAGQRDWERRSDRDADGERSLDRTVVQLSLVTPPFAAAGHPTTPSLGPAQRCSGAGPKPRADAHSWDRPWTDPAASDVICIISRSDFEMLTIIITTQESSRRAQTSARQLQP